MASLRFHVRWNSHSTTFVDVGITPACVSRARLTVDAISLGSPDAWAQMRTTLASPLAKLVMVVLAWAYFHHFIAGIRHLMMDLHWGMDLKSARQSSAVTIVLAVLLTLGVAVKLW